MSETVDSNDTKDPQPQQDQPKDKVGDILHKERVTRRITIETIAKDLKLNIKYIKAIESNSLKDLPADPYVRVYLRSIATYLMLDPEEILRKFFEDRGLPVSEGKTGRPEKIKMAIEKDNEKPSKSWIIIIIAIVILAVLSYVSKKMGWLTSISVKETSAPAVIDTTEESSEVESSDKLNDTEEITEDTILQNDTLDSKEDLEENTNRGLSKDTLKLTMRTTIDSVWVQVFCDGVSWKNFVKTGNPRVFFAKDSINLHVGRNSFLRYTLNGKRLKLNGRGVKIFKIDHNGAKIWKRSKWNSVFKERL